MKSSRICILYRLQFHSDHFFVCNSSLFALSVLNSGMILSFLYSDYLLVGFCYVKMPLLPLNDRQPILR